MALSSHVHKPSALKQQNKRHNTLGHRTKGQINAASKGRVNAKALTKSFKKKLSKEQRRQQSKQIRSNKREEVINKKRQLGTGSTPPFLVAVIPLSLNINPASLLTKLQESHDSLVSKISKQGILHLSCSRLKQRFSFVIPPISDLFAVLDTVKVCDTILFVWKMGEEISNSVDALLSGILAQGLPTVIHTVAGDEDLPTKKKKRYHKELQMNITSRFPDASRFFFLDKTQDVNLILRQIGSQRRRAIFYRDHRSHIMAEKVSFDGDDACGTLMLQGFIRGQPMSVNSLIHIPGWGEFQMSKMEATTDPFPLELNLRKKVDSDLLEEVHLLDLPDPNRQESLQSTYEADPGEEEQTWPTQEEIEEAAEEHHKKKKKKVPKGTSDYQATWILPSDDEDSDDDSDSESQISASLEGDCGKFAPMACSSDEEEGEYEEQDEEDDRTTLTSAADDYDENIDYDNEMDVFAKMKAAKDDAVFPDEIDTPMELPARHRFQKYRGLQSFRSSPWDKNESLPQDYRHIIHFKNFTHTRRRIFKEDGEGALPGWYVNLYLKNVPRYMFMELSRNQSPIVAFSILRFEQKMSLINVVLKSHSANHRHPIKSKERLIFHLGFRRFANAPVFSEHTTGDKHKFLRFFHPGQTVVASMYAPVTFPPCPVSVYEEKLDGTQELVAIGSVLSADPDRIVCKRIVLSGHPFKVNPKSAVIRYMFFNADDVAWFKSVELRTKWGRRGHIKEALGTHGHMKCQFDGQLKSQDTVLMNLYKRVFPKWRFDPSVRKPSMMFHGFHRPREDIDELDTEKDPKSKKRKKVHFFP